MIWYYIYSNTIEYRTPTLSPPATIVTTKKSTVVTEPTISPSIEELKTLQTRIFTLIEVIIFSLYYFYIYIIYWFILF